MALDISQLPIEQQRLIEQYSLKHKNRKEKGGTYMFMKRMEKDSDFQAEGSLIKEMSELSKGLGSSFGDSSQNEIHIVKKLLLKKEKTDQEALKLIEYLRKYDFFQPFQEKFLADQDDVQLINIFKAVKFESFDLNKCIFEEGAKSNNKMYVIIQGNVSVLRKEKERAFDNDFENFMIQMTQRSSMMIRRDSRMSTRMSFIGTSALAISRGSVMGRGSIFSMNKTMQPPVVGANPTSSSKYGPEVQNNGARKSSVLIEGVGEPPSSHSSVEDYDMQETLNIQDSSAQDDQSFFTKTYGHKILDITVGGMFGELALQNNEKRKATIVTTEYSEFMVLSKQEFDYVKQTYSKEMIQKKKFLFKYIPAIEDIKSKENQNDIILYFQDHKMEKGQTVVQERNQCSYIYLLVEGRCTVTKSVMVSKGLNKKELKQFKICEIQAGSIIGEECFMGKSTYQFTVTVNSIEAKFHRFLYHESKKMFSLLTYEKLNQLYRKKQQERLAKLDELVLKEQGVIGNFDKIQKYTLQNEGKMMAKFAYKVQSERYKVKLQQQETLKIHQSQQQQIKEQKLKELQSDLEQKLIKENQNQDHQNKKETYLTQESDIRLRTNQSLVQSYYEKSQLSQALITEPKSPDKIGTQLFHKESINSPSKKQKQQKNKKQKRRKQKSFDLGDLQEKKNDKQLENQLDSLSKKPSDLNQALQRRPFFEEEDLVLFWNSFKRNLSYEEFRNHQPLKNIQSSIQQLLSKTCSINDWTEKNQSQKVGNLSYDGDSSPKKLSIRKRFEFQIQIFQKLKENAQNLGNSNTKKIQNNEKWAFEKQSPKKSHLRINSLNINRQLSNGSPLKSKLQQSQMMETPNSVSKGHNQQSVKQTQSLRAENFQRIKIQTNKKKLDKEMLVTQKGSSSARAQTQQNSNRKIQIPNHSFVEPCQVFKQRALKLADYRAQSSLKGDRTSVNYTKTLSNFNDKNSTIFEIKSQYPVRKKLVCTESNDQKLFQTQTFEQDQNSPINFKKKIKCLQTQPDDLRNSCQEEITLQIDSIDSHSRIVKLQQKQQGKLKLQSSKLYKENQQKSQSKVTQKLKTDKEDQTSVKFQINDKVKLNFKNITGVKPTKPTHQKQTQSLNQLDFKLNLQSINKKQQTKIDQQNQKQESQDQQAEGVDIVQQQKRTHQRTQTAIQPPSYITKGNTQNQFYQKYSLRPTSNKKIVNQTFRDTLQSSRGFVKDPRQLQTQRVTHQSVGSLLYTVSQKQQLKQKHHLSQRLQYKGVSQRDHSNAFSKVQQSMTQTFNNPSSSSITDHGFYNNQHVRAFKRYDQETHLLQKLCLKQKIKFRNVSDGIKQQISKVILQKQENEIKVQKQKLKDQKAREVQNKSNQYKEEIGKPSVYQQKIESLIEKPKGLIANLKKPQKGYSSQRDYHDSLKNKNQENQEIRHKIIKLKQKNLKNSSSSYQALTSNLQKY